MHLDGCVSFSSSPSTRYLGISNREENPGGAGICHFFAGLSLKSNALSLLRQHVCGFYPSRTGDGDSMKDF